MPRTPSQAAFLNPILADFSGRLAAVLERFVEKRIAAEVKAAPKVRNGRRKRAIIKCYYPGCANIAAPRFGMFCAAKHKSLPKAEKNKIRAKRATA